MFQSFMRCVVEASEMTELFLKVLQDVSGSRFWSVFYPILIIDRAT